jgi:branched-chain amino acid transport system permease protein
VTRIGLRVAGWLRQDSPLGRAAVGALVLSALVLVLCFIGLNLSTTSLVTVFLINLVAVVALGVFTGNSGIVSFGHAGFMGLAAYTSGILSMDPILRSSELRRSPGWLSGVHVSFPVGIAIGLVVVAAVAAVFGLAISRLPRDAASIATLGALVIANVVLLGADQITGGAQPLYGVDVKVTWPFALVAALIAIAIARLYRESRAGLQLRATREDELAGRALGANVRRLRLTSWVLSATMAGASGVLLGHFLGAFSPSQFYLTTTIGLVAMLIVGGATTVTGAVVGTALVTAINEVLSNIESGATVGPVKLPELFGLPTLGVALALVATMYFRRDGLMGRRELDVLIANWLARGHVAELDLADGAELEPPAIVDDVVPDARDAARQGP